MILGRILATASWISTFALIWLMIANVVGVRVIGFLIFFFLLAISTSAIIASCESKEKGSNGRNRPN